MDKILALDVDGSGTIGQTDVALYNGKVIESQNALKEFEDKLIKARAELGETGLEISTADIRTFFDNRKAERRNYLQTLFRQMGIRKEGSIRRRFQTLLPKHDGIHGCIRQSS